MQLQSHVDTSDHGPLWTEATTSPEATSPPEGWAWAMNTNATRRVAMMCFMWALTAQLAARFHTVSHHGHTVTATANASRIQGMDGVAFHRGGQHHPKAQAQNTPPEKRT